MNDDVKTANGNTESAGGGRNWVKLVIAVAVIAIGVLLAWHFDLFAYLSKENFDNLKTWFEGFGFWAPLIFILVWIAACVFFLPGLPVTIVGAFIFGPWLGTVYSIIGSTLGATAAFLVGRYGARGMVEGMIAKNAALRKIDDGVEKQGWRMLMITRLVPIFPFNAQNYVYGLTKIPLAVYTGLSFLFMIPGCLAYNFAAGKLLRGEFDKSTIVYLAVAAIVFVLLSLVPGWIKKKYGGEGLLDKN